MRRENQPSLPVSTCQVTQLYFCARCSFPQGGFVWRASCCSSRFLTLVGSVGAGLNRQARVSCHTQFKLSSRLSSQRVELRVWRNQAENLRSVKSKSLNIFTRREGDKSSSQSGRCLTTTLLNEPSFYLRVVT